MSQSRYSVAFRRFSAPGRRRESSAAPTYFNRASAAASAATSEYLRPPVEEAPIASSLQGRRLSMPGHQVLDRAVARRRRRGPRTPSPASITSRDPLLPGPGGQFSLSQKSPCSASSVQRRVGVELAPPPRARRHDVIVVAAKPEDRRRGRAARPARGRTGMVLARDERAAAALQLQEVDHVAVEDHVEARLPRPAAATRSRAKVRTDGEQPGAATRPAGRSRCTDRQARRRGAGASRGSRRRRRVPSAM